MKAVHFGAGNIGRGFVGLILHNAGYELVFADVNAQLIDALAAAPEYTVHEVGAGSREQRVRGFRALNSATQAEELTSEIATAEIVTTAVGPTILRFIAPHIIAALRQRDPQREPLQVMACENAINATDILQDAVIALADEGEWAELSGRAVFANTAVDRIVPGQSADAGLDVVVESFFEWVIERGPFGDAAPVIPDATFVDDLAPYIERKLFTVNTGHAATAYLGFAAGHETIAAALADPAVADAVGAALEETSTLLVQKHGLDPDAQRAYREKILLRFTNPYLEDTVQRVGRQPLRKLSRHERFIGPAAELAERGLAVAGLLNAVVAALDFDDAGDEQSVQMLGLLAEASAPAFVSEVMGLDAGHPLFDALELIVAERQQA